MDGHYIFENSNYLWGKSSAILRLLDQVSQLALVDRPVLITGERGTGAEAVAARLHSLSLRKSGPWVSANCTTTSDEQTQEILFGKEDQPGLIEQAHTGILYIDEIATIPVNTQQQLVRIIDNGEYLRPATIKSIQIDLRIIVATQQEPAHLIEIGQLRPDLLERLSVCLLQVPPLRQRKEDIPGLANNLAKGILREIGHNTNPQFDPQVIAQLLAHTWPGNIQELKTVIERAVISNPTEIIRSVETDPFRCQPPSLPLAEPTEQTPPPTPINTPCDLPAELDKMRNQMIQQALKETHYNQKEAAKKLGLTYDQIRGHIKRNRDNIFAPENT